VLRNSATTARDDCVQQLPGFHPRNIARLRFSVLLEADTKQRAGSHPVSVCGFNLICGDRKCEKSNEEIRALPQARCCSCAGLPMSPAAEHINTTFQGRPPKELADAAALKKAVSADPKAIGYILKSDVDPTVKVILELE
jgi:hypothetical protein